MRKRLVATTTASQQKASIPLIQVAEIADIVASNETLQDAFASEDYHGPVAWVRTYSSAAAKAARLDWAHHYAYWTQAD